MVKYHKFYEQRELAVSSGFGLDGLVNTWRIEKRRLALAIAVPSPLVKVSYAPYVYTSDPSASDSPNSWAGAGNMAVRSRDVSWVII